MLSRAKLLLGALVMIATGTPACASSPGQQLVYFDNDFEGPGQSNIQALIPLVRNADVHVLGVGVVTGDAWLTEEVQHALRFLEIAHRADVAIHPGAEMPLLRTPREMRLWEAQYGRIPWKGAWSDIKAKAPYHPDRPAYVPPLPEGSPTSSPSAVDAVNALIQCVRAHPGQVTVIAAGPLTNIALALRIAPDIAHLAKEIVLEGGKLPNDLEKVNGDTDANTDFNFLFDPEAAHIVLTSNWKSITVVGDVTTSVRVTDQDLAAIKESNSRVAQYVAAYAERGQPYWDEITTSLAVDRTLVTKAVDVRMDVDLLPGPHYGQARIWNEHFAPGAGEQMVHLVQAIDATRFRANFVAEASK